MIEKLYKCVMCEGNVYPCIFSTKSGSSILATPIGCPFGNKNVRWEEVSDRDETISYDTDGRRI
jgi:hypothetical protein